MKWFSVSAITALLLTTTQLSFADAYSDTKHGGKYPAYPKINFDLCKKPMAAKRGEYLTKMGDCIACHTAVGGTPFAGGTDLTVPFGPFHFTFYGPNITPDKETGIGNWTEAEFVRTLRDGASPHGLLFPAFPYLWFNRVKTADLQDIKSYLDCLPPVKNKVPKNKMLFPFNIRFLQTGWRLLFFDFHKAQFKENPHRSKQWNRGAYIVEGLGHCGMCHTPMNLLGGPERKYAYTGGIVEGFLAPNISGAALKSTPISTITNVFEKDQMIGGEPGSVKGGMLEVNHDSLKYLKTSDLQAIAIYLKTIQSEQPPKPKLGTGDDAGKGIYEASCQACHTTGAGGAPKIGDVAAWNPRIKEGINTLYKHAILGYQGMPAKGACATCTTPEIQAAVRYIIHQTQSSSDNSSATPKGPAYQPITSTEAQAIYQDSCGMCHDTGKDSAPKLGDIPAWQPILKPGFDIVVLNTIQTHRGIITYRKNDAQLIAVIKYMANKSSNNNYNLW